MPFLNSIVLGLIHCLGACMRPRCRYLIPFSCLCYVSLSWQTGTVFSFEVSDMRDMRCLIMLVRNRYGFLIYTITTVVVHWLGACMRSRYRVLIPFSCLCYLSPSWETGTVFSFEIQVSDMRHMRCLIVIMRNRYGFLICTITTVMIHCLGAYMRRRYRFLAYATSLSQSWANRFPHLKYQIWDVRSRSWETRTVFSSAWPLKHLQIVYCNTACLLCNW